MRRARIRRDLTGRQTFHLRTRFTLDVEPPVVDTLIAALSDDNTALYAEIAFHLRALMGLARGVITGPQDKAINITADNIALAGKIFRNALIRHREHNDPAPKLSSSLIAELRSILDQRSGDDVNERGGVDDR